MSGQESLDEMIIRLFPTPILGWPQWQIGHGIYRLFYQKDEEDPPIRFVKEYRILPGSEWAFFCCFHPFEAYAILEKWARERLTKLHINVIGISPFTGKEEEVLWVPRRWQGFNYSYLEGGKWIAESLMRSLKTPFTNYLEAWLTSMEVTLKEGNP